LLEGFANRTVTYGELVAKSPGRGNRTPDSIDIEEATDWAEPDEDGE